jgi:hypothetical protein
MPSAQLVSAKGIELDPKSEEAETWSAHSICVEGPI